MIGGWSALQETRKDLWPFIYLFLKREANFNLILVLFVIDFAS